MYIEMKEQTIKDIELITGETFNRKDKLVDIEELKDAIKDLLVEYDKLQEQLEDEKEQRDNYYKPISEYENIGMDERDF
jgi:hypothetical protein